MTVRHLFVIPVFFFAVAAHALELCLPTANLALLHPGHDAEYFQATIEGTTASGMFGCVRRSGNRFHEGIDIKCLTRDQRGEPTDSVHAVADGEVAFVNDKPGLSNYGRYILVRHRWDGVEVYTLYAHLRSITAGVVAGQPVKKGQAIGGLGRSTNSREGISQDRAHLHFEVAFMLNTGFRNWYAKRDPKAPPFGNFNGQNFFGIDPAALLRAYAGNTALNFADYIQRQSVAFTVLVGARGCSWIQRHPEQLRPSANRDAAPVAYELGVTAWGLPVTISPRSAGELTDPQRRQLQRGLPVLRSVNETELQRADCRGLLKPGPRAGGWEFSAKGGEWAELLMYSP